MTRSTRRRRSRGGSDTPYNALMTFLTKHQEYQSEYDMHKNPSDVEALTKKEVMDMIRECKPNRYDGTSSIINTTKVPKEYHKQLINFIRNVCLAMKIDYKNKCKNEGVNPETHKGYQSISNKYRDTFGNEKNLFSFFSKKNPTLEDAINAWSSIHFFWTQEVTTTGLNSSVYRGGSRRRKTRKN